VENPFYLMAPEWARLPLVLIATAATIIASQAVISGAFSVTHQAIQLGFLPRLRTLHTSEKAAGQIYLPAINWGLLAMVLCWCSASANRRGSPRPTASRWSARC
jgi:KUP system potassium uptake protein